MKRFYPYWSRQKINEFMVEHDSAPLRKWGQNFLIDPNIVSYIISEIEATALQKAEFLVEIGPGLGALTHRFVEFNKQCCIFEIDPVYCRHLKESSYISEQTEIIEGDFLKNLHRLTDQTCFLLGNLPYYISSDILTTVVKYIDFTGAVFMVQKEFGERLAQENSSLSIFISQFAKVQLLKKINANCFYPRPNKESMLISLQPHPQKPDIEQTKFIETILKIFFWGKRKTIQKCLKISPFSKSLTEEEKDIISNVLNQVGISLQKRADEINHHQYNYFFQKLSEKNSNKYFQ